jgi:hypothetical protein
VPTLALLFLATAVPIWVGSWLLWSIDGGQNLWALKNTIELSIVAVVAAVFSAWATVGREPPLRRTLLLPVFIAVAAFVLGGFKAGNDYLDPPDLLLGILAQWAGFLFVLWVLPARPRTPPVADLAEHPGIA